MQEAACKAFVGQIEQANDDAIAALELSRDRQTEYGAALAFTLSGSDRRAKELAIDLAQRFPDGTSVRFNYLPVLRARLALNKGERMTDLDLLEPAMPFELGTQGAALGSLYPIYVQGEIYLSLQQGTQAATEFQKIVDHPGIIVSEPIGALAHL